MLPIFNCAIAPVMPPLVLHVHHDLPIQDGGTLRAGHRLGVEATIERVTVPLSQAGHSGNAAITVNGRS